MGKRIYKLIDECRKGMKEIDENFRGAKRIEVQEKEEGFYKTKFEELGVKPIIISDIYSFRDNDKEIQEIKNNIENRLITN